jgi:hypothetical protein
MRSDCREIPESFHCELILSYVMNNSVDTLVILKSTEARRSQRKVH